MSVGDQDHGRIAMPVPARFARRRHQLLDLGELRASSLASVSQANVLPRRLDADQCTYATSGHPVVGGITPKLVEVVMMPSHTADETAKRPPTSRPARKGQWRRNDYLAVAVGLLFVTAMLLSFRINDWVMQTFAWDY